MFKSIKKIAQLKEFGGDTLTNKQLTQYIQKKDTSNNTKAGADVGMMLDVPNLTQAQKLRGYLQSVSTSDTLIEDFEKEFEEIVVYIINIKQRTYKAFDGLNTLEVQELINSLIQVSDVGTGIEPNLRIICLKVIRKVIELEN